MEHQLSALEFAHKWLANIGRERGSSQEHFIDVCRLLGVRTPNEADPTGTQFAFEKGAKKELGGTGYADVWKRKFFAWEYKGKRKSLKKAYEQLLQYREALENPPLLVVSDMNLFEIHTNFTGTRSDVYEFSLSELRDNPKRPLDLLRALFIEPQRLEPKETRAELTERAAAEFAKLAVRLRARKHEPFAVAHFLNKIIFCLFAQGIGLLPPEVLSRTLASTRNDPKTFSKQLRALLSTMAKGGGYFGPEKIEWFNGGLFDDGRVLPLEAADLLLVESAARLDWSSIEPAILGTLFERGLDPDKRSQLGAHYTDIGSIERVIEPVVMRPLRAEFDATKARVQAALKRTRKQGTDPNSASRREFNLFLKRLRAVRVLDPACGSGNFLYIALQRLKALEKEAILWGAEKLGIPLGLILVGPQNVCGIEKNTYAAELARTTIWIGEIQWMLSNGFGHHTNPILRSLENIECRDAILDASSGKPRPADWPSAEFIVGNPPFLGGKKLREGLGSDYVDSLFEAWRKSDGDAGVVPREADLVCYWHEKARQMIRSGLSKRAGLIATKAIWAGENLEVLRKVKESGDIFLAWRNEEWVVDGAEVRIAIVGQDDGTEANRQLDGEPVGEIYADLSAGGRGSVDLTTARRLVENVGIAFMGDTKGGPFDLAPEVARTLLSEGPNPNGRPNSDVVVPWANSMDVTRRPRGKFIIDFGVAMSKERAAQYEAPFEYLRQPSKAGVYDFRRKNRRPAYAERWWIHVEARPSLRTAIKGLQRFIVTPTTSKHRVFQWMRNPVLPDHQLIVIARADDYTFGVLQSRVHELWSLRRIGRKGVGNDPVYAPSLALETFPFPFPHTSDESALTFQERRSKQQIGDAAAALVKARSRWLNPPELIRQSDEWVGFRETVTPRSAAAAEILRTRTLTNLYNSSPQWLVDLNEILNASVLHAYGLRGGATDNEILARLLDENHRRPTDLAEAEQFLLAAENEEQYGRRDLDAPKAARTGPKPCRKK